MNLARNCDSHSACWCLYGGHGASRRACSWPDQCGAVESRLSEYGAEVILSKLLEGITEQQVAAAAGRPEELLQAEARHELSLARALSLLITISAVGLSKTMRYSIN